MASGLDETKGAEAATEATEFYRSGKYLERHSEWHLGDAPGKALDLQPSLEAVHERVQGAPVKIADVGAGVGGVMHETVKVLATALPSWQVEVCGYEIAEDAVRLGRERFPELDLRNRPISLEEGPFDVLTFVDVLEHLENPWEMLRLAAEVSSYVIVRQPLLGGFSTFRHRNYTYQRNHLGHIAYFTVDSFLDMADATGWRPIEQRIVPPWELHKAKLPKRLLNSLIAGVDMRWASYLLSGFYLNAAFAGPRATG